MVPQRTYSLVTPAIPTPARASAWGAGTSPARAWRESQAAARRAAARLREALAPPGGLDGGGRAAVHLLQPSCQESLLDSPPSLPRSLPGLRFDASNPQSNGHEGLEHGCGA